MANHGCRSRVGVALVVIALASCKRTEGDPATDAEGGITTTTTRATSSANGRGPGGSAFSSTFEGAITMSMTSPRHPPEGVTFFTKGSKLRFQGPGHDAASGYAVFDADTKKVMTVMDAQKMYIELDLSQAFAGRASGSDSAKPTITETGKHETVAGYDCEDWTIKDAKGKHSEACMAQGIAFVDFSSLGGAARGAGATPSWIDELRDKKYFPLKAVEYDEANIEISRMEVTKIEAKNLDDALFAPPAGYKKMEMPTFAAGLPTVGGALPRRMPATPGK